MDKETMINAIENVAKEFTRYRDQKIHSIYPECATAEEAEDKALENELSIDCAFFIARVHEDNNIDKGSCCMYGSGYGYDLLKLLIDACKVEPFYYTLFKDVVEAYEQSDNKKIDAKDINLN